MASKMSERLNFKSVEELLGVVNEEAAMDIEIYKISGFKGHPFKVVDDEKMQELVESIKVKGVVGLLLGAMLVCTFIWYRTQFMNYILLGVAEFMLAGVLAAGAFILVLETEARDGVGRCIIGG